MTENLPETDSLLPYARWAEDALRIVVLDALGYAAEHGLPGEHHFYLTFRTDAPGVVVPGHLKARYPQEMTIVLQHRFWDLKVDRAAGVFSVGLSFGGVPAVLTVPVSALSAFADPHVRFGLRFQPELPRAPAAAPAEPPGAAPAAAQGGNGGAAAPKPQVVSLDAFRRRPSSTPK
jgi:uncharacterized protein